MTAGYKPPLPKLQVTARYTPSPLRASSSIFAGARREHLPTSAYKDTYNDRSKTKLTAIYELTKIAPKHLGVPRARQHGRRKATGSPHPTGWGHTRRMQRGKQERQTSLWSAFDDGRHSKISCTGEYDANWHGGVIRCRPWPRAPLAGHWSASLCVGIPLGGLPLSILQDAQSRIVSPRPRPREASSHRHGRRHFLSTTSLLRALSLK